MIKKLQRALERAADLFELLLAITIAIFIVLIFVRLMIGDIRLLRNGSLQMSTIVSQAMSIAVAIEFIKMLCLRTPSAILEVLMFAISRSLIVDHASPLVTVCGVGSIAALFAIRKFLMSSDKK